MLALRHRHSLAKWLNLKLLQFLHCFPLAGRCSWMWGHSPLQYRQVFVLALTLTKLIFVSSSCSSCLSSTLCRAYTLLHSNWRPINRRSWSGIFGSHIAYFRQRIDVPKRTICSKISKSASAMSQRLDSVCGRVYDLVKRFWIALLGLPKLVNVV